MRYSEKYPDDMLENLAESPWTCSDGLGSALNEIPKGVSFLEREQEREREEVDLGRVGEEKGGPASLTSHALGPTRARNPGTVRGTSRTVREVRGRFTTSARTVCYLL
jgi:hypothetical protein